MWWLLLTKGSQKTFSSGTAKKKEHALGRKGGPKNYPGKANKYLIETYLHTLITHVWYMRGHQTAWKYQDPTEVSVLKIPTNDMVSEDIIVYAHTLDIFPLASGTRLVQDVFMSSYTLFFSLGTQWNMPKVNYMAIGVTAFQKSKTCACLSTYIAVSNYIHEQSQYLCEWKLSNTTIVASYLHHVCNPCMYQYHHFTLFEWRVE